MRKIFFFLLSSCLFIFSFSCKKKRKFIHQDETIYSIDEYNAQTFDSTSLYQFVEQLCTEDSYCQEIFDFYRRREFHYAWIEKNQLSISARTFINRLNEYKASFHDTSLIDNKFLAIIDTVIKDSCYLDVHNKIKKNTEFLLTTIFFRYATKEYYGIDKNLKDLEWYIPRKKKDFQHLIDTLVNAPSDYEIYEPINRYYKGLKDALKIYRKIEIESSYHKIDFNKSSDSTTWIIDLKNNLLLLGDLMKKDSILELDSITVIAIKKFQSRMGLVSTGIIDDETLKELNIPIQIRIKQILINLERLRWFPDSIASDYIIVNIPEYKLHIIEQDTFRWSMNVVVGKEANATNIFMGNITHAAFSPYWNVPTSIIRNELLPKIKNNPSYIEKNNMEIVSNGNIVSSSSIDWSKFKLGFPFTIRQRPGPGNALGGIKFLFPNSFSIYLHDTPSKSLFKEKERAFSHGCIRLGEPAKLAKYLFRTDSTFTPERINKLMNQKSETISKLPKSIPVIITYLTTWVNYKGEINFRKDIYGHDKKLYDEVFGSVVVKE